MKCFIVIGNIKCWTAGNKQYDIKRQIHDILAKRNVYWDLNAEKNEINFSRYS